MEMSNKETLLQDNNDENKETQNSDVIGLLVVALNMTQENEIAKDLIADALNAIKDS